MRIGGPPQPQSANTRDVSLIASRIAMVAKRLCEVETWRRLYQDLVESAGDDIMKLEERADAQEAVIEAQGRRIARLEALLGVAIEHREVRG